MVQESEGETVSVIAIRVSVSSTVLVGFENDGSAGSICNEASP